MVNWQYWGYNKYHWLSINSPKIFWKTLLFFIENNNPLSFLRNCLYQYILDILLLFHYYFKSSVSSLSCVYFNRSSYSDLIFSKHFFIICSSYCVPFLEKILHSVFMTVYENSQDTDVQCKLRKVNCVINHENKTFS